MDKTKAKKLIKVVILVLIIALPVLTLLTHSIKEKIVERQYIKNIKHGYDVKTEKEWINTLKDKQSSISGKTLYDLYEMGLNPYDGADTDFDGLTDKEEIEVYHTDPLKASTSGDLYSDSYKVEHDMDLNTYYEYKEPQVFSYNKCENVSLEAASPTDFYAVVKDVTEDFVLDKYNIKKIYKGYCIYNFGGTLQIDLSDIISSAQESDNKAVCLFKGDLEFDETLIPQYADFNIKNQILTLDESLDDNEMYYLFIVDKPSIKDKVTSYFRNKFFNDDSSVLNYNLLSLNSGLESTNGKWQDEEVIITGPPLLDNLRAFFSKKATEYNIYCTEDTSEKTLEMANTHLYNIFALRLRNTNTKPAKKISKAELALKLFLYKHTPLNIFLTSGEKDDHHWWQAFWVAYIPNKNLNSKTQRLYDDDSETKNEDIKRNNNVHHYNVNSWATKRYRKFHCNFEMNYDELQFQNFGSEYSENGNCCGIVHLTACLYNKGYYSSTGKYKDITWDISKDSDNKTLTDKKLYDYKSWDFVDNNSDRYSNYLKSEYLSSGELEFVKMIAAANRESNDKIHLEDYMASYKETEYFRWETIQNVMAYLDQDKVVEVGIYFNRGKYGHQILFTDYWWDHGNVVFGVYDPNIPMDDIANHTVIFDRPIMAFKKVIDKAGRETYKYAYNPLGLDEYYTTNIESKHNGVVFFDENFNVFNVVKKNNSK